ncbi:DUF983 domain-containing protein [Rufibacter latericius]|uniref:DUF983 domain-containing protein n=1 Tax=Rufibacter latericius TaxID=2487040 RepID=A0A3M9MM02_9BACT|nr:DUF983 domain-containing protein [Rufibacter latericius]RNI25913.1 DUF983 domain-containing protein [Rufibacter latericius]
MLGKGSKLYSIAKLKCPRCHEGDLFENNSLMGYRKMSKMLDHCPVCNQIYEPEPGYYYGAMFVSYGLTAGPTLAIVGLMMLFSEEITLWMFMAALLLSLVLFMPALFKLSRAIWINIFISYNPEAATNPQARGH